MVNYSININKMNNHLSPKTTEYKKKTTTCDGNQSSGSAQKKKCIKWDPNPHTTIDWDFWHLTIFSTCIYFLVI